MLDGQGLGDAKIQRVSNKELGNNAFQISTKTLTPTKLNKVRDALDKAYGFAKTPDTRVDRPDLRQHGRQERGHRDHRLAAGHQRLHRAALRVEVRGAGADRVDARPPDHRRRLLADSAGR